MAIAVFIKPAKRYWTYRCVFWQAVSSHSTNPHSNVQPDEFDWESGRVGIGMRKFQFGKKTLEQSNGGRKEVDCISTIRHGAIAGDVFTYQIYT